MKLLKLTALGALALTLTACNRLSNDSSLTTAQNPSMTPTNESTAFTDSTAPANIPGNDYSDSQPSNDVANTTSGPTSRLRGEEMGVPSSMDSAALITMQAQAALNGELNAGIREDGIMGPETRAAIRQYQRENNLMVTSVLDPETLSSLDLGDEVDRSPASVPSETPQSTESTEGRTTY